MSYTEIFAFNKEGNAYMAGMARNSWRGAMMIWNIMEERHLPPYIPEYVKPCNWYHPGMTAEEIEAKNGFKPRRTAPTLGKGDNPAREIWALADNPEIPRHERIVLLTTFDDCLVKKEDIPRVVEALRAFEGDDHKGETNLGEQADILQAIYDDHPEIIAVGWNQTSVTCENWGTFGGCDEESGEPIPYNCLTGDKHYWLFDELKEAGQ
jgi:hypothetical protein